MWEGIGRLGAANKDAHIPYILGAFSSRFLDGQLVIHAPDEVALWFLPGQTAYPELSLSQAETIVEKRPQISFLLPEHDKRNRDVVGHYVACWPSRSKSQAFSKRSWPEPSPRREVAPMRQSRQTFATFAVECMPPPRLMNSPMM